MLSPAEVAAKRLAFEMGSWRSIELKVCHGISHPTTPKKRPDFDHLVDHYIETAEGWRLNDNMTVDGSIPKSHERSYYDGSRCAQEGFAHDDLSRQSQVVIKRSFGMEDRSASTSRPVPLSCFYQGQVPLPEALLKSTYLGVERVLGRECDRFLFTDLKWYGEDRQEVYSLDKATAVPLRILTYRDPAAYKAGKALATWEAESLDQVQGHWLPLRSKQSQAVGDVPDSLFRTYEVQEVAFDRPFAKASFWPVIRPDIAVYDATTNKLIQSPPPPKAVAKSPDASGSPPVPMVATPAVPPADWTSALPTVGIGLGIAALAVGILLWWRRR